MTKIEKYIERLKTLQSLYDKGNPQYNAFGIAIIEAKEILLKSFHCKKPFEICSWIEGGIVNSNRSNPCDKCK